MSVGILVVSSTGVGQSAEPSPLAKLASHWDTFKANLGAARHEARLRLAELASERDAQGLDADRFNERLAAFARTSPVWAAYSWPVAEFAKMPTVWFEPWDRVLLLEPNAEQRALKIEAQLDARTRALTTPDPTACFDERSKFTRTSVCEGLLNAWCWALFAADGSPSFRGADENFVVTREAVASAEQLRTAEGSTNAPYGHDEVRFAFCSAVATSHEYDFGFLRYASSSTQLLWRGYAWDRAPESVSSEQFESACHDRKRLKEIADQLSDQLPSVPRGRSRMTLERWTYGVNSRLRQCTSQVLDDCSNVYFRGGLPIAAYLDASCRRRDAAEAELSAEIESAGALANEATLAEPISQVNQLHACSWARANGYFWAYTKPNGSRCKRNKP